MAERGGKRAGAGRKSNADRLFEAQEAGRSLAGWFTPVYQESKWKALLESRDERVQFRALVYLSDRLYGKSAQVAESDVSGDKDFTITRVIVDI
jgi:hypothetical protein